MILHHLAGIGIFFYHLQQLLCTGACTVPLFTVGSRIPNDVRSAPGVCAVPDPAETAGLPVPDSRTAWDHSRTFRSTTPPVASNANPSMVNSATPGPPTPVYGKVVGGSSSGSPITGVVVVDESCGSVVSTVVDVSGTVVSAGKVVSTGSVVGVVSSGSVVVVDASVVVVVCSVVVVVGSVVVVVGSVVVVVGWVVVVDDVVVVHFLGLHPEAATGSDASSNATSVRMNMVRFTLGLPPRRFR